MQNHFPAPAKQSLSTLELASFRLLSNTVHKKPEAYV